MNDKIDELYKTIEAKDKIIDSQALEIARLKEKVEEYKNILKIQNEREYYSKFLQDFQKEKGANVLPDFDEVYKRYDNYKSILVELEEWLNKIIEITVNLDEKGTCKNVLDKIQELKEKYN